MFLNVLSQQLFISANNRAILRKKRFSDGIGDKIRPGAGSKLVVEFLSVSVFNVFLYFDLSYVGSGMKVISKIIFFIIACGLGSLTFGDEPAGEVLVFRGASDASAAVTIGEDMFIVADDENNILRVYNINKPGLPVFSFDLTEFLGINPEHPEADIEGATMIGRRIYWITSHGRNKDGKMRPNRYRYFATIRQTCPQAHKNTEYAFSKIG